MENEKAKSKTKENEKAKSKTKATMSESSEEATVTCSTSKGEFKMKFFRNWSPNGYDRAVELFERGFYDHSHFFRVLPGFLVQFGISYSVDKELKKFARQTIPDDPHRPDLRQFRPGMISFAGSGKNSRDTQLFISYGSAPSLGTMDWETAIGEVVAGFEEVIKALNSEYREKPSQGKIHAGPEYINQEFPNMDYFNTCSVQRSSVGIAREDSGGGGDGSNIIHADEIGTQGTVEEKKVQTIGEQESQNVNDVGAGRLGIVTGSRESAKENFPLFIFLAFLLGLFLVAAKNRFLGTQRRKKN